MKAVLLTLALFATATSVFAEKPKKKDNEPSAVSSDPVVGKWKVDHAKGEDVIWTFSANGALERHSKRLHEKGKWKRLNDQIPPAYQCQLNGGAAVIKVTYSSDPEHLSLHADDNNTRATAKRFQLK